MAPALQPGDFIFAFKLPFGLKIPFSQHKIGSQLPKRGDLIVFSYSDQPRTNYIKRVIGLPGDVVGISTGTLSVNEHAFALIPKDHEIIADLPANDLLEVFEEAAPEGKRLILHQKQAPTTKFGPLIVPPGHVFMLGDNRDVSEDSRFWGTVPYDRIDGKAVLIWLSLDWGRDPQSILTQSLGLQFPSVRWSRIFTSL
jgi:signal peptidase I